MGSRGRSTISFNMKAADQHPSAACRLHEPLRIQPPFRKWIRTASSQRVSSPEATTKLKHPSLNLISHRLDPAFPSYSHLPYFSPPRYLDFKPLAMALFTSQAFAHAKLAFFVIPAATAGLLPMPRSTQTCYDREKPALMCYRGPTAPRSGFSRPTSNEPPRSCASTAARTRMAPIS